MQVHVLSGDSLLGPFKSTGISGEVAVFRECFVDGPCTADSLEELYSVREEYLDSNSPGFYPSHVRPEIEKILSADPGTEIYLWFEHELFCQVNLWFLLDKFKGQQGIFLVSPPEDSPSGPFAGWAPLSTKELRSSFERRKEVHSEDLEFASELWKAFSERDQFSLCELGKRKSEIFPFLREVVEAAGEIDARPKQFLLEQFLSGSGFEEAFRAFSKVHQVYGFGDLQVKRIWDKLKDSK